MTPKLPLDLEQIAKHADRNLRSRLELFSPNALTRLNKRVRIYTNELTRESVRIAKRHQSDSVSAAYVDRAAEHLGIHQKGRWQKLARVSGALFWVRVLAFSSQ